MAVNWGSLIFGGVDSSEYGIYLSGEGVYNAPERAVEVVDVPGRNGSVIIDQGHWNNIEVVYKAGVFGANQETFSEKLSAFRNAILSQTGYQRLSDTYHPEEFRMGAYVSGLEVSPASYNRHGEFELIFNCKPQRWLVDGDLPIPLNSGDVLQNPTEYESSPLLISEGRGNIYFNGYSIGLINEPTGLINMNKVHFYQANSLSDENTFAFSFAQYKLEPGDIIHLSKQGMVFTCNFQFYYRPGASNIRYENINQLEELAFTYNYYIDDCYILFQARLDTDIEFTYGTPSTKSGSVDILFRHNNATYNYNMVCQLKYNGGSEIQANIYWLYVSGGGLTINNYAYGFDLLNWYLDSTYPVWGQDFDNIIIDCDFGEAYGLNNGVIVPLNRYVNFDSDLPSLSPGPNQVTFDNTITDLKIAPRWWKL